MAQKKDCTDYWLNKESMTLSGDFEGMYRDIPDPWGCAQHVNSLNNKLFLELLFDQIKDQGNYESILDIGCGLGHLTEIFRQRNHGGYVCGCDISYTAIDKAKESYPEIDFAVLNVLDSSIKGVYELIVLTELVWYLLDDLPGVLARIHNAIASGGKLAVKQYFPDDQRFGCEVLRGLSGFKELMENSELFVLDTSIQVYNNSSDGVVYLSMYRVQNK